MASYAAGNRSIHRPSNVSDPPNAFASRAATAKPSPVPATPRRRASANAAITFPEEPDVDRVKSVSPARPWAITWREKIASTPMSLAIAVSTAETVTVTDVVAVCPSASPIVHCRA